VKARVSSARERSSRKASDPDVRVDTDEYGLAPSGRATQILQGQLSRSTQPFHLRGQPWHDERSGTEKHGFTEVDHRQGLSLSEPNVVTPTPKISVLGFLAH